MPCSNFKPEPVQRFVTILKQMMKERQNSNQKHNDLVDMCVDWYDKLETPEFKRAGVTELSIFCQALIFFIAAQDQVSTMIAAVIYHMTQDPKIEKKVYTEVDAVFTKYNGKVERDQLSELIYLNACISEALRLYPFFHRSERVCTKEWVNEEYGLHIKKGMTVMFPIWAINRCSEYNPDGNNFNPDRFMPENKDKLNPYASTSFGFGNRNCSGMMFAKEMLPLISAHLMKEFKFVGRRDTKLTFIPGGPTFCPHQPVYVDVMER